MVEVKAGSICKRSQYGFHNWCVTRHNTQWTMYECVCTWCSKTSHMSAYTYAQLQDKRDKWLATEVKRRTRRLQRSYLEVDTATDVRPEGAAG